MRRVKFDETKNKIHIMTLWPFAYRNARKVYWELMVLDRIRFQRRIEQVGKIICHIFDYNHRCNIFKERFEIKERY